MFKHCSSPFGTLWKAVFLGFPGIYANIYFLLLLCDEQRCCLGRAASLLCEKCNLVAALHAQTSQYIFMHMFRIQ